MNSKTTNNKSIERSIRKALVAIILTLAIAMCISLISSPAFARTGSISALSVSEEQNGVGGIAEMSLEIKPGRGSVFIESSPLTRLDTQMSARLANEAACKLSTQDCSRYDFFYVIRAQTSVIGGPSAGGALAVLTYAVLEDLPIRSDVAMTGSILSGDVIGPVGGVEAKIRAAAAREYKAALVPSWESATQSTNNNAIISIRTNNPTNRSSNDSTNSSSTSENTIQINSQEITSEQTSNSDNSINRYGVNLPRDVPSTQNIYINEEGTIESVSTIPIASQSFFETLRQDPTLSGIEIVPVSTLDEAVEYFTGKKPFRAPDAGSPPTEYIEGMQQVAHTLCEHAAFLINTANTADTLQLKILMNLSDIEHAEILNRTSTLNRLALEQLERANNASARGDYYSAASLCFSSNLQSQESILTSADAETRLTVLVNLRRSANAVREAIDKRELSTISDLEVTMVASERLADAERVISEINRSSPSPRELAYASERLETARAWLTLIGKVEGKKLELNEENLIASCRVKIDEAQERVNYVSLLYPQASTQLERTLRSAMGAAQRQQSALCILQASQAKAEANAVLSALYIPEENYQAVIEQKRLAARQSIDAMRASGSFPILSYSYLEYASELAPRDSATAALYIEYSIELANLPIYFPNKQSFVRVDKEGLGVFLVGAGFGVLAGFALAHIVHRSHSKRERVRIVHPRKKH